MAENNYEFLLELVHKLTSLNLTVYIFGGWAEELWGLNPARTHRDIDLLYPAPDFTTLDHTLAFDPDFVEIEAKHFTHKRAYLYHNIMIEIILVQTKQQKLSTNFFAKKKFYWPLSTFSYLPKNDRILNIASIEALRLYRARYQDFSYETLYKNL